MPEKAAPARSKSKVHSDERHPSGVPKTIHHWEDGAPVYLHEVEPMDLEELVKLGHSKAQAQQMIDEANGNKKATATTEKE